MAVKAKSIRDTYLYSTMNEKGSFLDNLLKTSLSKGIVLTPDKLLIEVNTINKYYKYAMKKNVMEAYANGTLIPIVFPPGVTERLSAAIPFILGNKAGKIVAYVFIDNYKSYNAREDSYSIDPKKLYCLLESAYIGIVIQKMFSVLSHNSTCCVDGAYIFAHTFTRVLNKKYALNVDNRAYTKMLYLAAKYYLVNILGNKPEAESVNNYAMKVADCNSKFLVMEVDQNFKNEDFANIANFINAIKRNSYMISQSLAELTVKDYLTDYVNMYHTSAIFALEHLAYFMFMVDSVCLGAYLNNQVILEDIIDKSGAKLYTFISNYQI